MSKAKPSQGPVVVAVAAEAVIVTVKRLWAKRQPKRQQQLKRKLLKRLSKHPQSQSVQAGQSHRLKRSLQKQTHRKQKQLKHQALQKKHLLPRRRRPQSHAAVQKHR